MLAEVVKLNKRRTLYKVWGLGENESTWEEEDKIPNSLIAIFNGRQQDNSLQEFLKKQREKFSREEMNKRRTRSLGTVSSDGKDHGNKRSIRRNSGPTTEPSRAKKVRYSEDVTGKEDSNGGSSRSVSCSTEEKAAKKSNGSTGPSKAEKTRLRKDLRVIN